MHQFIGQRGFTHLKNGDGAQEHMRRIAGLLHPDGWAKMGAAHRDMRRLRRCIGRFEDIRYSFSAQDDAFRRLSGEIGGIESLLASAEAVRLPALPACGGDVRISIIAGEIISGGEMRLDQAMLMRMLEAFQSVSVLGVRELICFPEAMTLALLEELAKCCEAVIKCAEMRRNAQVWVQCGGKGRFSGNEGAVYTANALKCAEEAENAKLCRRIEENIIRNGQRAEAVEAESRRISAQLLMRAENLLSAWHMMRRINWKECYKALSQVEAEMDADPSGVYPNMDDESKSEIRNLVCGAAKQLGLEEYMIVNAALAEAGSCAKQYGEDDPRSTICYYLYENEGRRILSRRLNAGRTLSRTLPDPSGRATAAVISALTLASALLFAKIAGNMLLAVLLLPLGWMFVMQLAAKLYPLLVKPRRLLKMKADFAEGKVRTLVVMPALLSGEGRVHEMIERMETAGCLEKSEDIDFLLLGDFKDSGREMEAGNNDILSAATEGIRKLNEISGRQKYFYLHRARAYRAQDKKWMGENRKRGAVRALNALILGNTDAAAAFSAENGCAEYISRAGYRYVVTLDADTVYVPGTLQRLVGAMLHPLNRRCEINGAKRGYAVLQPAMQLNMHARENAYAETVNAPGGMDSYPFTMSDFYQDICGCGSFSGKGIYDVKAYYGECEGKLREDRTLSHDMVEGILSGSGKICDTVFYENCPLNLSSELSRGHRWMRGDWQNAYLLFSRLRIRMLDRLRILGNLLISLYAPCLLALLILSAWAGNTGGFALGIALAFLNALINPLAGDGTWRRAVFKLAVLPAEAKCALDAVIRTLWRTIVSQKRLMEWTAAADTESGEKIKLWGRLAAALLLPALLNPGWILQTVALAALFFVGGGWAEDLKRNRLEKRAAFTAEQVSVLGETALATWRFFEKYVPEDGNGLPPDNVQLDPPAGIAHRTSPTNIGLYLVSCLAAYEMGFIRMENALKRVRNCIATIERMEKWQGQIYNWYDTETLEPLKPRYVSSVDSGNLAAALMLAARGFEEADADIAKRAVKIAQDMDFTALYDEKAELFRIGVDVENATVSQAHYDLYASEARILSFAAMMLGKVPVKHWQRLNRAGVDIGNKTALVSWSGTMFEYLMPEIFMHSHAASLAGISCKNVVAAQMDFADRCARPWGISESGYYAFDMHLNYQYRAFGLQSLALSANAAQDVVAPYASALALCVRPGKAAENLKRMKEMGWQGEYGFYEAADYLKTSENGKPRLVKSHMAHHQGMILCAICNALRDNALSNCFMDIPQARSLRPLLEERAAAVPIRLKRRKMPRQDVRMRDERTSRSVRRDRYRVDTHLLSGGGTTALVTGSGAAYAWYKGTQINRFSGDLTSEKEGMYVHLSSRDTGESAVLGAGGRVRFDAGWAEGEGNVSGVQAKMKISVSPENGALVHVVRLKNTADTTREVQLAGCFAVALAPQSDMRAHPAFQNLFIECRREAANALCFARRPRERDKTYPQLLFAVFGGENTSAECDMERLVGRNGAMGASGRISECFEGVDGAVNPCGALRTEVALASGEEKQLYFVLAAVEKGECGKMLRTLNCAETPERGMQLASTLARTSLHSTGLNAAQYKLLQRASALLFDAHFQPEQSRRFEACVPAPRELIWRAGISGDLPVILVDIQDAAQAKNVRDIIRMHAFYREMGVWTDIVLLSSHANDYRQPVRDAFEEMVNCSHLAGLRDQNGGVHIIDRANADENVVSAIERIAAMRFHGSEDAFVQLDRMLDVLNVTNNMEYLPMAAAAKADGEKLKFDNDYGGFTDGGYRIRLSGGMLPPAPWSNIMAEGESGAVITERCGGFAWSGNSRSARLTAFSNDTLSEGWGWMFYAADHAQKRFIRLLPGDKPMADFSVLHKPCVSRFACEANNIRFETSVRPMEGGIEFEIVMENMSARELEFTMNGFVDWLMGVDENDRRMLRTWNRMGACFASGAADCIGYFACDDPKAHPGASRQEFLSGGDIMRPMGMNRCGNTNGGWVIELPVFLKAREKTVKRFILGAEKDAAAAYERVRRISECRAHADENWLREMQKMKFDTPNEALNLLANGFLQNQVLNCRILAKTGLYQPGGAYGFRDQLQDMLLMIHYRPHMVRQFLLKCASRQFEAGDVLHWWHEPMNGVRTHISDDKLFLPYVTAQYVRITGDEDILQDNAAFLKDIEIPQGREDVYAPMQASERTATLHKHCMRAFRSAEKTGVHGLCLMGSGDWNDGMNRIGAEGRGESIWLSMFAAVCAKNYAEITKDEADRAYLLAMNERLCAAIEENGWDGAWYLRAYTDDGRKLGGGESECCRIDLISQAWSVFAGLDQRRVQSAMNAAWQQLVDRDAGAIRLLAPPFDGKGFDPGYIGAYPAGIRENGAQYTHAACWYGIAMAEMGDEEKTHEILDMLLPVNHALNRERADKYRVEPYVVAADIYTNEKYAGRGGWTWYTGSAQWLMQLILSIFGYERRENKVCLRPLMGKWKRASISISYGSSEYVLTADIDAEEIMLDGQKVQDDYITMQDDGRTHHALFPPRKAEAADDVKTEEIPAHHLKI